MPPPLNSPQSTDTSHMLARPKSSDEGGLPPHKRSAIGPTAGIIIILVLIVLGALYFAGAYLNRRDSADQLPFIPEESSTQASQ